MVQIENLKICHATFVLQSRHESFSIDFLDWENIDVLQRMIQLNPNTNKIAIDTLSGQPVGFILGGDTGLRGVLHHLFVSNEYRKSGIGYLLMAECIKGFRDTPLGSQRILGYVYGNNIPGIKLLKQNGFVFNPALEKNHPFVIPCYLDL